MSLLTRTPSFPCLRCKREAQCITRNRLCTDCRAKAFLPKDSFCPHEIALQEAAAKYGEATAEAADRLCWGSTQAMKSPELLRIGREMHARMAQLAGVETQSERTARTIDAQRAAQDRKRERRRKQRDDDEEMAA